MKNGEVVITKMDKEKSDTLFNTIYKLELSHLEPQTRRSLDYLDSLLADDFIEFGSSGKKYNKEDILKWLPVEPPREFIVNNFSIIEISEDVVLATYELISENLLSMRSSLWKFKGKSWKMVFHQGTKCP